MKTTLLILAIVCIAGVAAQTTSGCPPGMYSYVAGKICGDCHWSCKTCSGAGSDKCNECYTGEPENGECDLGSVFVGCDQPLCSVSNTFACGQCAEGYRFAMKDATTATAYCVECSQTGCSTCTVDACTACFEGYFMDTTSSSCKACDSGCNACTGAGACTTCAGGYFLNAGACTACSDGCAECESATKCTTCADQYLLSQTAFTCTLSEGCLTPSTDGTKCSACYDGYRLLNDGTCKSCDTNAAICSTNSADQSQVPIACNGLSYILATKTSAKAAVCASRNEGACVDQTADGVCNKCDAGWTLSNGKCVDCEDISTGCSKCTDGGATAASTCTACRTGYYFASGACTACDPSCASCDATSCTCDDGYFPTSPASTTCTFCNAGGAKSGCTEKNASSGCLTGYGAYSHGICQACDPTLNCASCTSFSACATCKSGSSVYNGACVVCDPACGGGCSTNGAGKCDGTGSPKCTVASNLVYDTLNKKCGSTCVDTNCDDCSSDLNSCITCKDGYFKTATNTCTACSTGCKTCSSATASTCTECWDNKLLDTVASPATYCTTSCTGNAVITAVVATFVGTNVESCTIGTSAGTPSAIVCKTGFIPKALLGCYPAPSEGCTATKDADDTKCKTCSSAGYVLNNAGDACLKCSSISGDDLSRYTCTQTSDVIAATCVTGHLMGAGPRCFKKDPNCSYTATATTTAAAVAGITSDYFCDNTCAGGYYKDANSKCIACPTGCSTCTNATTCQTCDNANGYYQNTASGTSCVKPSIKCSTQTVADKCTGCAAAGFYLSATTSLCVACAAGCQTCSATACTACYTSAGFLQDASVTATFTCKACISNCKTCTDFTTCATCNDGYYLQSSDKTCVACPTNAATCTDASTVQTCVANYFVSSLPKDADGKDISPVTYCKECTDNCLSCTIDATAASVCTLCDAKGNYYLTNEGKSCSNADCSGSDGKVCNQCSYGERLDSTTGACVDCTADNSCPASCEADTTTGGGGTGVDNNNTTSATDSGSKIAFSLFVLAFIAILGHMMI